MAFTPYVKFEITYCGTRYTSDSIQITPSSLWNSGSDTTQYSYDGNTWYNWTSGTTITIYSLRNQSSSAATTTNQYYGTLYLRGKLASMHTISSSSAKWTIAGTGTNASTDRISISGSISALFDYTVESPTVNVSNACSYMFQSCTFITSARNLELNVTPSGTYFYYYMFQGCTNLQSPPALPATSLSSYCYAYMFSGCTNLQSPPALPATSLTSYCYYYMFRGCTKLQTVPALPATTLNNYCYANMFDGCTSLIIPPALPATSMSNGCYKAMFNGCTSLMIAPNLPATSVTGYCYRSMFAGCTSLTIAPKIAAASVSADYTFENMFNGCTSLNISSSGGTIPYMLCLTSISGTNAVTGMFTGTAGSTSDPSANTKYYCSEYVSIGASSYNILITAVAKLIAKNLASSTTVGGSTYPDFLNFRFVATAPAKKIVWKLESQEYTPNNASTANESTVLNDLSAFLSDRGLGADKFARGTVANSKYYIYLVQAIADFIIKRVIVCYASYYTNSSGSLRPKPRFTSDADSQVTFSSVNLYLNDGEIPEYSTPTHINKTASNMTEADMEDILNCLVESFEHQSVTSPKVIDWSVTSSSSSSSSSCSSSSSTSSSCSCSSIFIAYFNI